MLNGTRTGLCWAHQQKEPTDGRKDFEMDCPAECVQAWRRVCRLRRPRPATGRTSVRGDTALLLDDFLPGWLEIPFSSGRQCYQPQWHSKREMCLRVPFSVGNCTHSFIQQYLSKTWCTSVNNFWDRLDSSTIQSLGDRKGHRNNSCS